jgi:hypothetical protein
LEVAAMTRTLWGALGEVPDRRGLQGQQYKLRSLLGISIGAMLAGANDLRAIGGGREEIRQVDASNVDGAPVETAGSVAAEGAPQPPAEGPGRCGGL